MSIRAISFAVMSLGICAISMASEYKSLNLGFKETPPTQKDTKMTEFTEGYKVEGAVNQDRQIASEKDSIIRDPSSLVAESSKPIVDDSNMHEEKQDVKPWLYRTKLDSN